MTKINGLMVFKGNNIRRTWHSNEWWFSIVDVVKVLTDSADPKQYIKKMRSRDSILSTNWGTICTLLELIAPDGKKRKSNCVNTEGAFRIIQSIPSAKAEPLKLWLARVGYERVEEIKNPALAQKRMRDLYLAKGYPNNWIEKRVRGIAIRDELTSEWKIRGVNEGTEFAILTNEISKAAFGKTVNEYKQFKGLKKQNLRDHMTDWELILNMLSEKATTDISVAKNSQGFNECKDSAQEGGEVAKNTRNELEKKTGNLIVSNNNYLKKSKRQIKFNKQDR
ncbi:Bro-N domain-containing protein [Candidatus Woesearchaeota archaeon]|jgi:DNA-damage-inducible protein D|nr:Bro-N domain-containing protein [Candidatus Woesearchaeota archaeon]MBT6518984.1 Bro-N domain-containing protein [Candidatus Woesearchaeota archaeon]MBT7368349.1 Bro-N domain-containing protein [Candidatus Woesearchaeota archaeon]